MARQIDNNNINYGVVDLGKGINSPDRIIPILQLFEKYENQNISLIAKPLINEGIKEHIFKYHISNTNSEEKCVKRLLNNDLKNRCLVYYSGSTYNITSLGKKFLEAQTYQFDDLYIRFLAGYNFPNPCTQEYTNRINVLYLIIMVIDIINQQVLKDNKFNNEHQKLGIYQEELAYILLAKTNDPALIAKYILNRRKKRGTTLKEGGFKTIFEDLNMNYYGTKKEDGLYSGFDEETIRGHVNLFLLFLGKTKLFRIHGGHGNSLIEFSHRELAKRKAQLLLDAYKQGKYNSYFNWDNYVLKEQSKDNIDLFIQPIYINEFSDLIVNFPLPWDDATVANKMLSEVEHIYFYKTYETKTYDERIKKIFNKEYGIIKYTIEPDEDIDDIISCFSKLKDFAILKGLSVPDFYEHNFRALICKSFLQFPNVIFDGKVNYNEQGISLTHAPGQTTGTSGADISIHTKDYVITFETTLVKAKKQQKDEWNSSITHLMVEKELLGIKHGYSILISPTIHLSTIVDAYQDIINNEQDLVIPICESKVINLLKKQSESNNSNYFMEKIENIVEKITNNQLKRDKFKDWVNSSSID